MNIEFETKIFSYMWRLICYLSPAPLSRRLMTIIPPGVKATIIPLSNLDFIKFDHLEKSEILKKIFWMGVEGYEPETTRLFYILAKKSRIILDIGSYIGYYTLISSKSNPFAQIHSFEPFPDSIELQKHFIDINACKNITVHNVAIGSHTGVATFYVPDKSLSKLPNIGSLINRFQQGETFSDRSCYTIRTKCISLDGFICQSNIENLDLVKIDTEETEIDVLLSGRESIRSYKPDIILEIISRNKSARRIIGLLKDFGYKFYDIRRDSIQQIYDLFALTNTRLQGSKIYGEILCSCRSAYDIESISKELKGL